MKVKDIANIIDLHSYSFRLLIKFYDEDGFFIGFMYKDNATDYHFISDSLYDVWRCCIYQGIADFYDENGFYIGRTNRSYTGGGLSISDELKACWKNNIKISRMYTLRNTVMFTFMVLKGGDEQ